MSRFVSPVLVNPTWPSAGDDSYTLDSIAYMKRVTSNPGNMVFLHAIRNQIEGIRHYKERGYTSFDSCVWGCSNFIHHKRTVLPSHPVFSSFDGKYIAIGLGAQAPNYGFETKIPGDTIAWLNEIIRRAPGDGPNITVRGRYTFETLERHGLGRHAVTLGCPSLFINPSTQLGALLSEKAGRPAERIAVAPGYVTQCPEVYLELERSLARIAFENDGLYICQGPEDVVTMARGEFEKAAAASVSRAHVATLPDLSADDFRKWFKRHAVVFGTVPAWMECLRTCDFVVGTRIHGTVLALQSGTPALCIVLDARQQELCEQMLIPWVWWEDVKAGFTLDDMVAKVAGVDWHAFDTNRIALAKQYVAFLEGNGYQPTAVVKAIAAGDSGRPSGVHAQSELMS